MANNKSVWNVVHPFNHFAMLWIIIMRIEAHTLYVSALTETQLKLKIKI